LPAAISGSFTPSEITLGGLWIRGGVGPKLLTLKGEDNFSSLPKKNTTLRLSIAYFINDFLIYINGYNK
jgi:hypothetical protein